jgi:release factor glutamine methyltransferase
MTEVTNSQNSLYEPAEDSFLLSKELKKHLLKLLYSNPNLTFLEVGTGTGIHLQTALKAGVKKQNIFASDIDSRAVDHCTLLGFNCIQSDLFKNIKGNYDIIAFNPPYLPLDEREPKLSRLATTGGKHGNEIILKFLQQAKNYLNPNGTIFLITSSLTPEIDFRKLGYIEREVGRQRLFYETIYVWELSLLSS